MSKELYQANTEVRQLNYQNSVLEKDIHTCNFERVNLTKAIENQKSQLNELDRERRRIFDRKSIKFTYNNAVSRIDTGSAGPSSKRRDRINRNSLTVVNA